MTSPGKRMGALSTAALKLAPLLTQAREVEAALQSAGCHVQANEVRAAADAISLACSRCERDARNLYVAIRRGEE